MSKKADNKKVKQTCRKFAEKFDWSEILKKIEEIYLK
jgi:hypothetical protein